MKRLHIAACATAVALAGAVAAVPSFRAPSVEMSGERAAPSEVPAGSAINLALLREQFTPPGHELFARPAAAKPRGEPVASTPALPSPPPVFPYRYAGKFDAGRGVELYLASADGRLQLVRAGTVLGAWRIDRATPDGIEVTYLPSEHKQAILLAAMTGDAETARALPPQAVAESAFDGKPQNPQASTPAGTAGMAGIAGGMALGGRAEPRVAGASAASAPKPVASSAPAAGAPLGVAAPTQGSMPTSHAGASGSATIQTGPTPSGTLGEATPTRGRLGE